MRPIINDGRARQRREAARSNESNSLTIPVQALGSVHLCLARKHPSIEELLQALFAKHDEELFLTIIDVRSAC